MLHQFVVCRMPALVMETTVQFTFLEFRFAALFAPTPDFVVNLLVRVLVVEFKEHDAATDLTTTSRRGDGIIMIFALPPFLVLSLVFASISIRPFVFLLRQSNVPPLQCSVDCDPRPSSNHDVH